MYREWKFCAEENREGERAEDIERFHFTFNESLSTSATEWHHVKTMFTNTNTVTHRGEMREGERDRGWYTTAVGASF